MLKKNMSKTIFCFICAIFLVAGIFSINAQAQQPSLYSVDVFLTQDAVSIYTVFFETNGGSKISSQSVMDGDKAARPEDPVRKGYIFDGWYSDKNFKKPYDFNSPVKSDITLYAKWIKEKESETTAQEYITYADDGMKGRSVQTGDSYWHLAFGGISLSCLIMIMILMKKKNRQ